jgi:hypothetical protein
MVVSSSLLPTQQADVCPKKCHVSFFVELTVKLNTETKLTNRMQIQRLFYSFSSVRDRNDNKMDIEGQKWLFFLFYVSLEKNKYEVCDFQVK